MLKKETIKEYYYYYYYTAPGTTSVHHKGSPFKYIKVSIYKCKITIEFVLRFHWKALEEAVDTMTSHKCHSLQIIYNTLSKLSLYLLSIYYAICVSVSICVSVHPSFCPTAFLSIHISVLLFYLCIYFLVGFN